MKIYHDQSPKLLATGMSRDFLLSCLSLLWALQWFVATVWIFFKQTAPSVNILPEELTFFGGEQIFFWVLIFIAQAVIAHAAVLLLARREGGVFNARLAFLAGMEALLTFGILSAVFKILVYANRPQLAQEAGVILLLAAALHKIFWPQWMKFIGDVSTFLSAKSNEPFLKKIFYGLFLLFIFLIIFVPNPEAVIARMFFGEQFHHLEGSVLAAAWAYTSGCILNIDVSTSYGLGLPVLVSLVTKLMGGLTYINILLLMLWASIMYYALWFILLRRWYSSMIVAAATLLTAMRVQLFHTGAYPFVFTYPNSTPLRFLWDVVFFWAIYTHLQNHRRSLLWIAGCAAGFMMFFVTSEGVYLTITFYFYVLMHLLTPHLRDRVYKTPLDLLPLAGYVLVPLATLVLCSYVTLGEYLFTHEYWKNATEFVNYFLSGFGTFPIYQSLKSHLFLQSLMGFVYPVVYVITLIIVGSLWFLKKTNDRDLLVMALCVYGLGLYHYYVALSTWTSYYMNGLPFIFVGGYWLNRLIENIPRSWRRKTLGAVLAVSVWALVTNHAFISYPNLLNLSRNPIVDPVVAQPLPNGRPYFNHLFYEYPDAYKLPVNSLGTRDEGLYTEQNFRSDDDLVALYRQETDFSKDVALIQKLTKAGDKVPLFSSYEIMILMKAQRKPFFYYFPIVNSRPLRMRNFVTTTLFTTDHLKKTLDQLERDKPPYVFMEAIFLTREIPQAYLHDSPGLGEMLSYFYAYYEPVEQGQYLVALKRKAPER